MGQHAQKRTFPVNWKNLFSQPALARLWRPQPHWQVIGQPNERQTFASACHCLQLKGQTISADPLSSLIRTQGAAAAYYVKRYQRRGKGLRRWLGRSRAEGEWQNLRYFDQLGIPTPPLVAYGWQRPGWLGGRLPFGRGQAVLVTAEVVGARDLASLAQQQPQLFRQRAWLEGVLQQVADYSRQLHHQGFVHWDLKWRNILLVDGDSATGLGPATGPRVMFFDCPLGHHPFGWLRQRGADKDLACLDKLGRRHLSRSRRLRFYLHYRKIERLDTAGKQQIGRVLAFFHDEKES